jgi:hypothetical protein
MILLVELLTLQADGKSLHRHVLNVGRQYAQFRLGQTEIAVCDL